MKAIVLKHAGGPENFYMEDRPLPQPSSGWVLIKIKAFGLNRSELMTRKGLSPDVKFPRVLGIECVGEVEDDPTREFSKGQKVAAFMGGMGRDFDGSYAEYTLLPKSLLIPFDSTLSWLQLGAIPEMFQTVFGSLFLALKIQKNEVILIRGGTSSVGMLAAQLSKNAGLILISTTRNPKNTKMLMENGADHVVIDDGNIFQKIKAIFPSGVHKVLELIGTSTLKDSLLCTRPGGTVCMTGMLAEQWSFPEFTPMEAIPATVNLTVYDSGQIRIGKYDFQQFIHAVEKGKVKLTIGAQFNLADVAAAHNLMENNAAAGKIVILT